MDFFQKCVIHNYKELGNTQTNGLLKIDFLENIEPFFLRIKRHFSCFNTEQGYISNNLAMYFHYLYVGLQLKRSLCHRCQFEVGIALIVA